MPELIGRAIVALKLSAGSKACPLSTVQPCEELRVDHPGTLDAFVALDVGEHDVEGELEGARVLASDHSCQLDQSACLPALAHHLPHSEIDHLLREEAMGVVFFDQVIDVELADRPCGDIQR